MPRRFRAFSLFAGLCFFIGAPNSTAQDTHETASQKVAAEDEETDLMKWKLINTGIFVLLLGAGIMKLAPRFFQARSLDIQKAIKDATGLKIDADFRYSEIDKKMANLPDEVARMRAGGAAEMEREHERLKRETDEEIAHMGRGAEYEIEGLRAEGALQVKQHTAQLAFALAERRLQAHFAQNDGQNGVRDFVNLVGSDKNLGSKN